MEDLCPILRAEARLQAMETNIRGSMMMMSFAQENLQHSVDFMMAAADDLQRLKEGNFRSGASASPEACQPS
eukprot:gene4842-4998_t